MPVPDLAGLLRPRPAQLTPVRAVEPEPEPTAPKAPDDLGPDDTARLASRPVREGTSGRGGRGRIELGTGPTTSQDTPALPARQYLRPIPIYLPRELHRKLHQAAAERGTTATALLLTAVNTTHQQLPAALAADHGSPPGERGGQLFEVPQNRSRRRRDEPSVATTIRVTDSQYDALVELVQRHHSNRSAVITAALRLYLPSDH